MKKLISVVLAMMLLTGAFTGCGKTAVPQNDKLSIVTTIFPEYDWVRNILGDKAENADVTMLLDSGVDLHSYQPTADDIVKISSCDLFIYAGGESDAWVEDALKEGVNEDMLVIDLLDVLGESVKEEEVKEGMEEEAEEAESDADAEAPEYDEHVWLSLKNAGIFVDAICGALSELDGENAEVYNSNASAYIETISALDAEYQSAVDGAAKKTLLFGDRFPFRYLVDDYGIDYYAAFVGCSAESEASFETVTFLAGKVDELGLSTVLALEGSDRKLAETVVAATKNQTAQILTMDSMQSVTAEDVEQGVTYLSIMEKNLQILTEALK